MFQTLIQIVKEQHSGLARMSDEKTGNKRPCYCTAKVPCFRFPGCHFPAENGGAEEDRTPDLLRARQALSQLSYGPFFDYFIPNKPATDHPICFSACSGGSGWI
jgi:hypothetical protein